MAEALAKEQAEAQLRRQLEKRELEVEHAAEQSAIAERIARAQELDAVNAVHPVLSSKTVIHANFPMQ